MSRSLVCAAAFAAITCVAPAIARAEDAVVINEPLVAMSATPIADYIAAQSAGLADAEQGARPVAIEYSDAHYTRAKIHKYASWVTLPLMAAETVLGEKLYNDPNSINSSSRGVHGAVGAGLIGFFGLQAVTGTWNLLDASGAPGHKKRLIHGILMFAAEGGFVASAVTAPGHSRNALINFDANKATHRDIAYVSMGVGAAGYLLMLLTGGSH
jgi:hypothetical protein